MIKTINPIILILLISDIIFQTGFGLFQPIFALYLEQEIVGATIFTIALASSVFLIVKSIVQLPFSIIVDKKDANNRKHLHRHYSTWFVIIGTLMVAIVPFFYLISTSITHIFLIQLLYGVGSGLVFPAWMKLWQQHLDEDRESFEWSLYSTLIGMVAAVSGGIGGFVANVYGFQVLFILVGIISVLSAGILLYLLGEKNKSLPTIAGGPTGKE